MYSNKVRPNPHAGQETIPVWRIQ